jgi:hypothetical protein
MNSSGNPCFDKLGMRKNNALTLSLSKGGSRLSLRSAGMTCFLSHSIENVL